MHDEPKPQARGGLLSADHSKRGRRFVSIMDPDAPRVTLLEPWEHAILVLCDGSRGPREIAVLLEDGVEGERVSYDDVLRSLKFFERESLIAPLGLRRAGADQPAGPRTLANLQLAYREWHKDPVKTGQILAGDVSPFLVDDGTAPVGLSPTVALPDDEEGAPPVAIGTELVLSSGDGLEGGQRPLRSVFEQSQDARTEIGALDEAPRGPRTGGSAAAGVDDDLEDIDDLELGDVADLLAAVDDDFDALEADAPPAAPAPPPVRAVGGETELPRGRDEATAELVLPKDHAGLDGREAALTPTMVGVPAPDGDAPVIVSPPRPPSRRGVERVGAVIGPSASAAKRNVAPDVEPATQELGAGIVVEDTQRFDLPTEGSFAPRHPGSAAPTPRHASVPPSQEETTNRSGAHLPKRARAVFERLWALGLAARTVDDEPTLDANERRRRSAEAEQFQSGLERLTAGDLELALTHFETLQSRMPDSRRILAFADAVRHALDDGLQSGFQGEQLYEDFTGAVADVVAGGRCPRCLCALDADSETCPACGFAVRYLDAARTAL